MDGSESLSTGILEVITNEKTVGGAGTQPDKVALRNPSLQQCLSQLTNAKQVGGWLQDTHSRGVERKTGEHKKSTTQVVRCLRG